MTPKCIQVDERLFKSIVKGNKTSFLKRGRRDYPLGRLQVMNNNEDYPRTLEIDIKWIRYIRAKDIPESEPCLKVSVIDTFPDVRDEEEITEVGFSVPTESLADYVSLE